MVKCAVIHRYTANHSVLICSLQYNVTNAGGQATDINVVCMSVEFDIAINNEVARKKEIIADAETEVGIEVSRLLIIKLNSKSVDLVSFLAGKVNGVSPFQVVYPIGCFLLISNIVH